jgi:hypothetical protein
MIGAFVLLVYLWLVGMALCSAWPVLVADGWNDERVVARAFRRELREARGEFEFYACTRDSEGKRKYVMVPRRGWNTAPSRQKIRRF